MNFSLSVSICSYATCARVNPIENVKENVQELHRKRARNCTENVHRITRKKTSPLMKSD